MQFEKIKQKKEEKEDELFDLDNVVSVGVGRKRKNNQITGEESIVIGVTKKIDEDDLDSSQIIPSDIDGVKTDVVEIGEPKVPPLEEKTTDKIKAFLSRLNPFSYDKHKEEHRPVPLGVSIGHHMITAGTSSFILVDERGYEYPASNNHVLARCNKASKGDPIIQPGAYDGGTRSENKVGELEDYIPIEDGVTVDLAWLSPQTTFENEPLGIEGTIRSPRQVKNTDKVIKTGRTTDVTTGNVIQTSASVKVKYPDGRIKLKDQIITTSMSKGGDSGSPVFVKDGDNLFPVGLLFAGSKTATIINNIDNVISESGMSLKVEKKGGEQDGKKSNLIRLILKLIRWFLGRS